MTKTGVYQIRNLKSGKCYIGSTSSSRGFDFRWTKHRKLLSLKKHHSPKLQAAWNKYGQESFVFEIIEQCEPLICLEREQYYLNTILCASINSDQFDQLGYNISRIASNPMLGRKHTSISKQRISDNNSRYWSGKSHSEETKIKISQTKTGTHYDSPSLETRLKISRANSRLTIEQVIEIRRQLSIGIKPKVIMHQFGICKSAVSSIKYRRNWGDIHA